MRTILILLLLTLSLLGQTTVPVTKNQADNNLTGNVVIGNNRNFLIAPNATYSLPNNTISGLWFKASSAPINGYVPTWNSTTSLLDWLAGGGGGGSGTVTTFSAGTFSPFFNTTVSNPTTTPALSFIALTNVTANTGLMGPPSGVPGAYSFRSFVSADIPSLSSLYLPLASGVNSTVGGNVIFSSSVFLSGANITSLTVPVGSINASGTPSSSTFLRGDGSWNTPSGSGNVTLWPQGVGYSNGTVVSAATANQIAGNLTTASSNIALSGNLNLSGTNTAIAGLVGTGNSTLTNLNTSGNTVHAGTVTMNGNVAIAGNVSMTGTNFSISGLSTAGIVTNNNNGTLSDLTIGTGLSYTAGNNTLNATGGGTGNITTGSVTSANGITGSATSGAGNLNFTLATSVTGTLWGNGTAFSAATANQIAGNLTTASSNIALSGNLALSGTNIAVTGLSTPGVVINNANGTLASTTVPTISGANITSNTIASGSLANTTVTPGTYGSTTVTPVITINQQGQITAASNATIAGGGGGNVTLWPAGVGYSNGTVVSAATANQIGTNFSASSVNETNSGNWSFSGTNVAIAGLVATGNSTFTNTLFSGNGNYSGTFGVQGASIFNNVTTGNISMAGTTTAITSMTNAGLVANNSSGVLTSTNVSTGLSNSGGNLTVTAINPMIYGNIAPTGNTIGTSASMGSTTIVQAQASNATQNGFQLPAEAANKIIFFRTPTGSTSNTTIYPQVNSTINGGAANASISVAAGGSVMYVGTNSTNAQQITFFDPMLNYPVAGNWSFSGNESFSQAPFMSGLNINSNTVTALTSFANNSPSVGNVFQVTNATTGLGTWTNSSGSGNSTIAITSIKFTNITSSGNYTPSVGLVQAEFFEVGAGGGTPSTTAGQSSSGGGGGGYVYKLLTAAQVGTGAVATIGAGSAGSAGGNTTLAFSGGTFNTTLSGNGGGVGVAFTSASSGAGGTGGTATGGDQNIAGKQAGLNSQPSVNGIYFQGGDSYMGFGAISVGNAPPVAGTQFGGGSSGGGPSQSSVAGGNGQIIVKEYIGSSVGGGGSSSYTVQQYTSNQTLTAINSLSVFTGASLSCSLPTASAAQSATNVTLSIKFTNSSASLVIVPSGNDTIDGASGNYTMSNGPLGNQAIELVPNTLANGWWIK